ncbi:MAG: tetratricopeptide repeat protein [Melioribacteraceae bacterium]|nr:tetratricopeptide repeat protein [Melioribacteraceae bacterium]
MFEFKNIKIANRYFQKAFDFQMQGEIVEAKLNYLTSIEIHPTAEAYVNLGWTFSKEQNFDEAIKQCHKALEVDLNYGMAYSDIGFYLLKQGEIEESIVWFEEALNADDFDGKFYTYYNLGRVYEQCGRWTESIAMYNKSILLKPGFELGKKKLLFLSSKLN